MTATQMVSFQSGDERLEAYPGARHSFFNDSSRTYDPAASEDSWRRTLAFFKKHLG